MITNKRIEEIEGNKMFQCKKCEESYDHYGIQLNTWIGLIFIATVVTITICSAIISNNILHSECQPIERSK